MSHLPRSSVLLGSLLIGLTSCQIVPDNDAYQLLVAGPPHTAFSVQCTSQAQQWLSQDVSAVGLEVAGVIASNGAPQAYRMSGREIYCNVRNLHPDGSLHVTLRANNVVVNEAQEAAPTGDVGIGFGLR